MTNPITILLGVLLIFYLPGFLLLKALFPRRALSAQRHLTYLTVLSVLLSVTITILVGALLAFLPTGTHARGYFQGAQTGVPLIETALGVTSLILFLIALTRGAFPRLLGKPPAPLARIATLPPESGHYAEVLKLRARILNLERELARSGSAHGSTAQALKREISALEREASALEAQAAKERYGAQPDASALRKTL